MNAPVLLSPTADQPLEGSDALLRWEPVDGAAGYRVQVAADSDFETLVVDSRLGPVTSLHVRDLVPGPDGTLYWRVAAKGGPFATASFTPGTLARPVVTDAGDQRSMWIMGIGLVLSLITAVAAFVMRPTDLEATTMPKPADSTAVAGAPADSSAAPAAADSTASPDSSAAASDSTASASSDSSAAS